MKVAICSLVHRVMHRSLIVSTSTSPKDNSFPFILLDSYLQHTLLKSNDYLPMSYSRAEQIVSLVLALDWCAFAYIRHCEGCAARADPLGHC